MIEPDRHLGLLLRGLAMLNDAPIYGSDPRPALRHIQRIAEQASGCEATTLMPWPKDCWSFSRLWEIAFEGGVIDWGELADYCACWLEALDGEAS